MTHSFLSALTPAIGKTVRAVARLRGGGTALPGRVIESIDSNFMARTLAQLPYGVVLVSGTNGKTTTTRIVSSMLEQLGLKVFTNPTGSNFTRGVVSALLDAVDMSGKLHADIAVLELDEAYAVHFVDKVQPRYALLLNVLRDQLDRFGEIDTTAKMLATVAKKTTGTVVLNREDPRIAALTDVVSQGANIAYYGLSDELVSFFPSDDTMYNSDDTEDSRNFTLSHYRPAAVTLTKVHNQQAQFEFADNASRYDTNLKLEGVYNAFNAAGALAIVEAIMNDVASAQSHEKNGDKSRANMHGDIIRAVSTVTPAFGRGESIIVNGDKVELILVKNPMGFRLALKSFDALNHKTMIVINDEYADGRDMSWLWDVDFTTLTDSGVEAVSGVRATDMALRLAYDEVPVRNVNDDINSCLEEFIASTRGVDKHIYCTYTAMLAVRKSLSQITHVEDAGL
ncbi:Mur ligase family protein [Alloscardovia theropitheci]|uniref:Lipid II isoglutaminyl synthase (glutamine-hydrolyzing) subunit MurT n=1 Tax=Alloscardovia theropitheci TaxID=2496842 RepID=A0A4R0QPS4_9BIFI|nr:Mur ligase family protein [Alloscardovia theropitheci]TCD54243.1 Mur ligase family protein [Alloscardovia theropitheci]